jgi:hypothetical protein
MAWNFHESSETKGAVNLTLDSSYIWEPTAKEIPGIVPGQRLIQNFYLQGILFDPAIHFGDAEPSLKTVLNGFFNFGEGKR